MNYYKLINKMIYSCFTMFSTWNIIKYISYIQFYCVIKIV